MYSKSFNKEMFVIRILILYISFALIKCAKILVVVPTPSISHQVVFRALIENLIERGHNVVVITTNPMPPLHISSNNLRQIDVHDVSYNLWHKMIEANFYNETDMVPFMKVVFYALSEITGKQLNLETVQDLMGNKTEKFDLLILEALSNIALIFSHIFKAPVIQMSSFGPVPGNVKTIGGSRHPLLYPTHYHQRLYNLTFWEKLSELYNHIAFERMFKTLESDDDIILQSIFGNDIPPIRELKNNVHVLFLNMHSVWVHHHPVPSTVVYTWGIHKTPEKKLPKYLQSYLDTSENGVIYISFGTNFKTSLIPIETLKIMVKVLSRLPYNILWKWDMDVLPGKSENIKISKWFPQCDILRHRKLKLFITQGGLQSTEEAINAGVPLIGIPMFADQEYNTEKYVYFKIGVKLNFKSLTTDTFENAITTVLTDYESYRKNIAQLRTHMQDQPKPALENTIWWIEYVLRHGGTRHLRSPAANMSLIDYYELELVLVILSAFIVTITVLLLINLYMFKFRSV